MEKFRMSDIDGNIILHKGEYSYSNKPLKDWDCDNFVEYIKDNSTREWDCSDSLLCYLYDIDYLNHIPENYAPIYLYGVWQILEEYINNSNLYKHIDKLLIKRRINQWNKQEAIKIEAFKQYLLENKDD